MIRAVSPLVDLVRMGVRTAGPVNFMVDCTLGFLLLLESSLALGYGSRSSQICEFFHFSFESLGSRKLTDSVSFNFEGRLDCGAVTALKWVAPVFSNFGPKLFCGNFQVMFTLDA